MSFGYSPTLGEQLKYSRKEGLRKRNLSEKEKLQQQMEKAKTDVVEQIRKVVRDLMIIFERGLDLEKTKVSLDIGHTDGEIFCEQKKAAKKFLESEGFSNIRIENHSQSDGGTHWARVTFWIPE